jgi:mono/diheme cytochrome c family protein
LDNQVLEKEMTAPTMSPPRQVRQLLLLLISIVLGIALILFGIHQVQASDPYIKSVLALEGDATQGRFIFQMNCSTCHGINGDGQVGPSLHHVSSRKSRIGLIRQVTSGKTPPMPQFQPTPQEMADLLEFLESL